MKQEQETNKMTKEQAFEVLSQVCAVYKGTLAEHQTLQAALLAIDKELNPGKFKDS